MAITCPRCGSGFDVTLFQFGHRVRCRCGTEVSYPDQWAGHVVIQGQHEAIFHEDRCVGCMLATACDHIPVAVVSP
jgi:hypothetical protein